MTSRLAWVFIVSIFIASMVSGASAPMRFNYQGKLTDGEGVPLAGNHSVFFSLWNGGTAGVAGSGTKVFEEQATVNFAASGVGSHPVGGGTNQTLGGLTTVMMRGATTLFLQVAVDDPGNVVLPRSQVESVPYAITAADSEVRIPIGQPASFPITISEAGSYYLTGNITGIAGEEGILVTTSGVTLDLMGFQLVGVPGSLSGIDFNTAEHIVIRNGLIREWGGSGIDLGSANFCRVDNITAKSNGISGILVGQSSIVTNCIATDNVNVGYSCNSGSTLIGCTARDNNSHGIVVNSSSAIGCTSRTNGGKGISSAFASVINGCSADSNTQGGIVAGGGGMVVGCVARSNSDNGIDVTGGNSVIRGNNCALNGQVSGDAAGIYVSSQDNVIDGNSCTDNDRGIEVIVQGNFITRNICTANPDGNWSIVVNNYALVVQGIVNGVVINGNSGGVSPGSTDPNANFTF